MMRCKGFKSIFFQLLFLCSCATTGDMTADNQEQNLILSDQATPSFSYLALGDSYTIGERVESSGRWPNQLIDSLEGQEIYLDSATIIAQTGWRTDELKAALATHDKFDYDLVSLLIGVNDQYQGKTAASYEPAFEELLSLAIERVGGDKERVFVLSIPNYGYTPFGALNKEGITTEIAEYNQINKRIANDKGIWYFDISAISEQGLSDTALVAADQLHPSAQQYALWVAQIIRDQLFIDSLREVL
jgi:lysophospholipase L1-like esterase